MSESQDPSKLVLIASSQADLDGYVKEVLGNIFPFEYLQVESLDSFIENPPTLATPPFMAVVDGTLGTQICSEWIQTVKMNYECPVIVLHDSSVSLDFAILRKNGAEQIIHRTFDREFILDLILETVPLDWNKDVPLIALNPIAIEEIHPEMETNFDVYVHLPGNHKTIMLRRKGTCIEQKTLDKLSECHQHIYFKKTETKEFLEYARTSLSMKETDRTVAQTEKLIKSKKVIFEIMGEFFNGQANDFNSGRGILERCKKIVEEYELLKTRTPQEAFEYMIFLTNNVRTLYHDAINGAAFAALLGHCLQLKPEQIETLALAGLLHNVGLSHIPGYTSGTDAKNLASEMLTRFKGYPDLSVNMIKSKKVPLPPEVSNAIAEHQENVDGSGFPRGRQSSDIEPLAKILRIAIRIQDLTSLVDGTAKISGKDIFNYLKDEAIEGKSPHDLTTITSLSKAVNQKKVA